MAYFDTTSPAGVMSREITATRNAFSKMGAFLNRFMHVVAETSTLNARVRKVEALRAKSDEELAAMGIRRDDIVRTVFADMCYL